MCGGLASADDATAGFAFPGLFGPSMDNEQQDLSDESDGVPAIAVMRVRLRRMKRVIKHQHRTLERQAVLCAVYLGLVRIPCPGHGGSV
jgi:hypothetical protein